MPDDYENLIPFPFRPDMSQPIVETFGYLTDVITSSSGMEQRAQLREVPVGSIGTHLMLIEQREAQLANALLHGHQAGPFGVGRWQFCTALTADAETGDTELACDTEDIPFETGGFLLLWRDPWHTEIVPIYEVAAGVISLGSVPEGYELLSDWPAGKTFAMPMVVGRLADSESVNWEALAMCSVDLTFDVDGFRP